MTKPNFTYDEARRRYTAEFTHTDMEVDATTGKKVAVTYEPEAVCNNREMDAIFKASPDWSTCLRYMHAFVGTAGSRREGGTVILPTLDSDGGEFLGH